RFWRAWVIISEVLPRDHSAGSVGAGRAPDQRRSIDDNPERRRLPAVAWRRVSLHHRAMLSSTSFAPCKQARQLGAGPFHQDRKQQWNRLEFRRRSRRLV